MATNERGFILALAMFAIVALSVVGMASIFLASGEAEIAGNLRRARAVERCAQAGVMAMTAQLPDAANAITDNNNAYTYNVAGSAAQGNLYQAAKGHYTANGTGWNMPAARGLNPTEAAGIFTPGQNITNGVGQQTSIPFRLVATCTGPNNAAAEQSAVVLYRVGR